MFRHHLVAIPALSIFAASLLAACGPAAGPSPTVPAASPTSAPKAAATGAPALAPTSAPAASFPVTIKDDAGREVTIPSAPQRIVSISSSNTEILFALGLESRVVGVDQYSNYPPAAKSKPTVGGFAKPDLEKIVALEPDLVLGSPIHVKATLPELERHKLRTVIANPVTVKAVLERIHTIAKITGQQKEAESLVGSMQSRIDEIQAKLKGTTPARVFYEISPELHTAGPKTFVSDVLQLAGGANVAANAEKDWPQLSQEALILADPEVILLADQPANVTPEAVAARPGWGGVSAVKNKRVVAINDELTSRAGPRVVDGVEMVARILHPDRVK